MPSDQVPDMVEHKEVAATSKLGSVFAGGDEVALVDRDLHALIRGGMFKWPADRFQLKSLADYVQPASIDLPVSGNVFLVRDKILPFRRKVADLLPELVLEERSLKGDGAVLLKGQTYLIHAGEIALPADTRGCLSSKSSIGRVDLMVRGIVDDCGLYDTIPGGSRRDLWLEVSPRSFNVRIREGLALTQLMIFRKAAPRPIDLSEVVYDSDGQLTVPNVHRGSLVLSLRVPPSASAVDAAVSPAKRQCNGDDREADDRALPLEHVGFEAIATNEVIDLGRVGQHDHTRFFRPIGATVQDDRLTLEKDRFYILATKEHISIPTHLSAEMVPFSQHVGELRAHYAGFFDPGFGSTGGAKGWVAQASSGKGPSIAHSRARKTVASAQTRTSLGFVRPLPTLPCLHPVIGLSYSAYPPPYLRAVCAMQCAVPCGVPWRVYRRSSPFLHCNLTARWGSSR